MNVLSDTWRGLIRRRLWPVALLLVAALAAVPKLLAKQPDPAPAPAVPVAAVKTDGTDPAAAPTLVSATEDRQSGRRRYVLGARKDPFEPAPLPKAKAKAVKKSAPPVATPAPSRAATVSAGGGGGAASAPPAYTPPASTPPVATAPKATKPTYPANSLTVRFGLTSGSPTSRTLKVRQPLPSAGNPLLVYMGLQDHGKTAVFMVGSDVKSLEGDGRCDGDCTELRMKAGDTEFINTVPTTAGAKGRQYELDVLKIHASSSRTATTAKAAGVPAHAARRASRPRVHF